MKQFGMTTKPGKDLIMLTRAENHKSAINYFSSIKRLPLKEFNKIFVVTEIKN
jgi:hypothetical protein